MLSGFGAARDREGQGVLDRPTLVSGGHVAGQEGVAGADGRARLDRWRSVLRRMEGSSRTFSSPFTRQRGLELTDATQPTTTDRWLDWRDHELVAETSPSAVSAFGDHPVHVAALDRARSVRLRRVNLVPEPPQVLFLPLAQRHRHIPNDGP